MIPYKYEDNLEKLHHIYNQLDLITNYGWDSLVFNIKMVLVKLLIKNMLLS